MKVSQHAGMFLALVVFAVSPAVHAQDFKKSVEAGAANWDKAFNSGDAAKVAKMYGSEAVLLPPQSQPVSGEADIQQFWNKTIGGGVSEHKLTVQKAKAEGNMGYAYGRWQAMGKDAKGAQTQFQGNWSQVLERQGGEWKTVLHSWNW